MALEFLEFLQMNPDEIDVILSAQDDRMGTESVAQIDTEEDKINGGRLVNGDDLGNA